MQQVSSVLVSIEITTDNEFKFQPCFLPQVYDIKATMSNTSKSIELQWQSTLKEDPDIKYCKGSKRWQVKVLKYSKIKDTPSDYKIANASTVEWITVPKRDTKYTFTEDITENTYYSFQVGHLEKHNDEIDVLSYDDFDPLVFASHVYYFGEQSQYDYTVIVIIIIWICVSYYTSSLCLM